MFRERQNKWVFGSEHEGLNFYFRHFGSFMDNHEAITVDVVIHDENRIETRVNDCIIEV